MRLSIVAILLVVLSNAANAQSLLETRDEARQRHNAERYEQYRDNGYRAPLGGYNERLGDPAPQGTERPGYISSHSYENNLGETHPQRDSSRGGVF